VLQIPSTHPAIHGSDALLKLLSDEGVRSVYLLAIDGATKPWVMKMLPAQGKAVPASILAAETKCLCRMQSAHLAKVLVSAEGEASAGVVMEYVPGKSLATILGRAKEKSMLLPSELGVVVAHDAFAAMDFFHGFEGAGRAHGNVSPRIIMVGYSGDVKIVGYRLGQHSRVAVDVQVVKDLPVPPPMISSK